jgi:hypothetical protein
MRWLVGIAFVALVAAVIAVPIVTAQKDGSVSTKQYVDLQQLYARYNMAIDAGDAEAWAATFTPDGNFNDTSKGHDALVQFIKDWREKRDGANRRHLNSNLSFTAATGGAHGSAYLLLLNTGTRPATIAMTGMYSDELVQTRNGWRFKSRKITIDSPTRSTP